MPYQPKFATSSRSPAMDFTRYLKIRFHMSDFHEHASSESAQQMRALGLPFLAVLVSLTVFSTKEPYLQLYQNAMFSSPGT